jgi:hypothetical protein
VCSAPLDFTLFPKISCQPGGLLKPGLLLRALHNPACLTWTPGKYSLARLNATEEDTVAREARMAEAIRTVLECIGEDPDREGLLKTPLRYAKALLWMTRGYEERLSGALAWLRWELPRRH